MSDEEMKVTHGPTPEQVRAAREQVQGRMMKAIIAPPSGVRMRDLKAMLSVSNKLRDQALWELPLIGAAATTYQDLASTREWQVQGKINAVSRTVELINNVAIYDIETGYITRGFEAYLRRRALDHITVGRTAFATRNVDKKNDFIFEYLDPTRLYFQRVMKWPSKTPVPPVGPKEKVWRYGYEQEPTLQDREVHINHPIPVGFNRFIAPLLLVYPTALVAWLLREHDTSSLDGRKVRDLFLVDERLRQAIEDGMTIQMSLWAGADPTATGFPVIGANMANYTRSASDYIARLGLSNIPDEFDRKGFLTMYANEIAAAFGLALRQFYNEETTTNKALETVQEARQQQKGPAAFVRTEERLINNSPIVSVFASLLNPVKFSFVEEADTASMKDKATTFQLHAQALKAIGEVFGTVVKPEIWLGQMQEMGLLPSDIPIEDMLMDDPVMVDPNAAEEDPNAEEEDPEADKTDSAAAGTVSQSPTRRTPKAGDKTQRTDRASRREGDVSRGASKSAPAGSHLDYDDVIMNSKGQVIERRVKIYAVTKMLLEGMEAEDADEPIASDVIFGYTEHNVDSLSDDDDDLDPEPVFTPR